MQVANGQKLALYNVLYICTSAPVSYDYVVMGSM